MKTIRSEILIKGVISIFLPLFVFAVTHVFYISKTLVETAQTSQLQTTAQLRDNLDLVLNEIERSSIHLSNNSLIRSIFSNPGITTDEITRLRLQSQLDTIFFNFFGSRPEIEYINLSGKGFQFILHTDHLQNYRMGTYNAYVDSSDNMGDILKKPIDSLNEEYLWVDRIDNLQGAFHEKYIYLIKRIYDSTNVRDRTEIGRLIVGVNKDRLSDTLRTVNSDIHADASCILVSDSSLIAIHNQPLIDTLKQSGLFKDIQKTCETASSNKITYHRNSYMVSSYSSMRSGWQIIKISSYSSILKGVRSLFLLTVLSLILCSALAIFVAVHLADQLILPLQQLVQNTNQFTKTQQIHPIQKSIDPPTKKRRPFFLFSGSFRHMMFKYFFLISFVPLIIFIIVSYTIFLTSFNQENRNSKVEEISQLINSLNLSYYAMEKTSERIWTNFDFQEALLDIGQFAVNDNNLAYTEQYKTIYNIISYELFQNRYLQYIYVYNKAGDLITGITFSSDNMNMIPTISHFPELENDYGRFKTLSLDQDTSGITVMPMGNKVFCILQRSQKIGGHIGYLVFGLDIRYFDQVFQRINSKGLKGISLLKSWDRPIYQASVLSKNAWDTIQNQLMNSSFLSHQESAGGGPSSFRSLHSEDIANYEHLLIIQEKNNFSLIGQTGYDALLIAQYRLDVLDAITISMLLNSILILIFTLTGILFFIYRLSFSIAKPIQTLENAMENAHHNLSEVDTTTYITASTEIRAMADSFNNMTRRIRILIDDTLAAQAKEKEAELQQKEAELISLQSQINPHFLYNTLDTVNWIALTKLGRNNQISHIVTALSNLLRDSLANSNSRIPIEKQLKLVENYLSIQKIRYEERLHITWDIDDSIRSCASIPLLLQPIVENAINHGISKKEQGGHIQITGTLQGDVIHLTVHDDGVGISPEKLATLNMELVSKMERKTDKSIGLHNTNLRIKSVFGDAYGISVESIQGLGTKVILTFPAIPLQSESTKENPHE